MNRGGPTYYADAIDLDKVLQHRKEFQVQDGDDSREHAPTIKKLAAQGKGLKDMS